MNSSSWKPVAHTALVFFVSASLLAGAGCARWKVRPTMPWAASEEDEPVAPSSVVVVWTNAILEQASGPPARGFGGRLMFYDRSDKPVRVDGSLMVYAFNERGQGARDKPDRKYAFTREQFAEHYSKSGLGHSYSIWIPWDQVGGPQQQVSLIVRFSPSDGPTIVGSQAKVTLPGPPSPKTEVASDRSLRSDEAPAVDEASPEPVRPAAHYSPIPPKRIGQRAGSGRRQMTTATIALPTAGR